MTTIRARAGITISLLLGAMLLFAAAVPLMAIAKGNPSHHGEAAVTLQDDMRKLWEDHIVWTRMYIVSAVGDLPDQDVAAERLLKNQADIGEAVAVYYGDEAGRQLTELLREHILGAADLLAVAKSGDEAATAAAADVWYRNGDEIAAFLNAANPDNWPLAEMQMEMKMHLDLTLQEATARLSGDYDADVAAYDSIHVHILGMADVLSDGIMAQFPDRFE